MRVSIRLASWRFKFPLISTAVFQVDNYSGLKNFNFQRPLIIPSASDRHQQPYIFTTIHLQYPCDNLIKGMTMEHTDTEVITKKGILKTPTSTPPSSNPPSRSNSLSKSGLQKVAQGFLAKVTGNNSNSSSGTSSPQPSISPEFRSETPDSMYSINSSNSDVKKKKVHFTHPNKPLVVFSDGADLAPTDDYSEIYDDDSDDSDNPHHPLTSEEIASIQTMYPQIFGVESKKLSNVTVKEINFDKLLIKTPDSRFPVVYFPPQADVESEAAIIVGTERGVELDVGKLKQHVGSGAVNPKKEAAAKLKSGVKALTGGGGKGDHGGSNSGTKVENVELHDDFVYAMHSFSARSAKEMSMAKVCAYWR
jgi:hypothetical protein